jgi:hypothetical protein
LLNSCWSEVSTIATPDRRLNPFIQPFSTIAMVALCGEILVPPATEPRRLTDGFPTDSPSRFYSEAKWNRGCRPRFFSQLIRYWRGQGERR